VGVVTFVVVLLRSGPEWDASRPMEEQSDWPAHASFMDGLVDAGFIVLGGPLADDHRVVHVVEAESPGAVRAMLARDPWSETHLTIDAIEPWTIRLDGRDGPPRAEMQPELWVSDGPAALAFYEQGLGAVVEHRVGGTDDTDVVAQLSVAGARFWVSTASARLRRFSPDAIGGATGRVLLIVDDPASLVAAALAAGATATSPVGDEHGWRLGRFDDPFGHQWEVGHPLVPWPPASTS